LLPKRSQDLQQVLRVPRGALAANHRHVLGAVADAQKNKNLNGNQLKLAADKQPWDGSIKALVGC
jgi:hypothetical protein